MFGDSTPAEMFEVHMLAGKKESPVAWSYVAHMPEFGSEDMHDEITDDHQIVLYHYVTRSQQEFVERKLTHTNLGAYSADFAEAVGDNSTVPVSEHPDLDASTRTLSASTALTARTRSARRRRTWRRR